MQGRDTKTPCNRGQKPAKVDKLQHINLGLGWPTSALLCSIPYNKKNSMRKFECVTVLEKKLDSLGRDIQDTSDIRDPFPSPSCLYIRWPLNIPTSPYTPALSLLKVNEIKHVLLSKKPCLPLQQLTRHCPLWSYGWFETLFLEKPVQWRLLLI